MRSISLPWLLDLTAWTCWSYSLHPLHTRQCYFQLLIRGQGCESIFWIFDPTQNPATPVFDDFSENQLSVNTLYDVLNICGSIKVAACRDCCQALKDATCVTFYVLINLVFSFFVMFSGLGSFPSCFFPCHLASLMSPVFRFTAAPHHQSLPHSI